MGGNLFRNQLTSGRPSQSFWTYINAALLEGAPSSQDWTWRWLSDVTFEVYVVIFAWAIIEMSFFPLPTEIFIVPLVASQHVNPIGVAVFGALGSTIGGLIDYAIGRKAFDLIDSRFSINNRVARFKKRFPSIAKYGLPGLLAFGRAFPLGIAKPLTFVAGATHYDLRMFCVLVAGSSFIRYALAATFGSILAYIGQFIKL